MEVEVSKERAEVKVEMEIEGCTLKSPQTDAACKEYKWHV